jgi:hypothetical protein
MATRIISRTWKVEGTLTDPTSAKLSDPTGVYGIKRDDLSAGTITAATQADPIVLTVVGHGLSDSQMIHVSGVVGMTELNGNQYYVDVLSVDTLALYSDSALTTSIDGTSGYTAYVSGGTATPAEVADGTAMTKDSTGIYEYSFEDTVDIAYTAYVEIVYAGATYHFEHDLPARSAVGEMLASYSSLLERIGHYLFGIRSGYSSDQTSDIEECIKDGLHDVYTAHSWSFFRPVKEITTTAPYSTGTITVASGVVTLSGGTFPSWAAVGVLKIDNDYYDVDTRDGDTQITLEDTSVAQATAATYELGRPEYDLPTTFEAIEGDLTYEPGQSDFYPPIRQKHDGEIRRLRQDDPYHDRPHFYGVRTVEFDSTVGSRRRLSLYPTPDAAYVMKARMKLRATMIDETNCYPVGAESLTQVITEACLAAAERNYDEQEGRHTKRFMELLPLAIAADQEMTSPTQLGPDAPSTGEEDTVSRSVRMGDITLDGVTL